MKKLLLSTVAALATFGASAAINDLTPVWSENVTAAVEAGSETYNLPVAVDAAGNTIVAGSYSNDITLAGTELSAIGTSAYLAKYDATGAAKWAVSLSGSATITNIDIDENGAIYVAGRFADEVEIGTTSGESQTITGVTIDGAATTNECASFILKYSADGVLEAQKTFVPEKLPALQDNFMYYPMDGDVFFKINHIQVDGGKVYASATYTGLTTIDGVTFESTYNNLWDVFIYDLKGATVLSLNADLTGTEKVLNLGVTEALATDVHYQPTSVTFTAVDDAVYATFAGNGPLELTTANSSQTLENAETAFAYINVLVKDGNLEKVSQQACPETGVETTFVPYSIIKNDTELYVVGYESFAENYEQENEYIGHRVFVNKLDAATLELKGNINEEIKSGDITYYEISSVATFDNTIGVTLLGYYNVKSDTYNKGDFANVYTSRFVFEDQFIDADVPAVSFAAAGSYAAMANVVETGANYTLFQDTTSGVENTIVADENAVVEYFNLQGVRIEDPASGLVIRRQGAKVEKVLVK